MRIFYRLKVFAFALVVAMAGFIPAVAYGSDSKQNVEGIIEYNLHKSSADSVQEWINSELTRDAGAGSEWYIISLSNHGKYDFSNYKTALNKYLSENEVGSASSRLKYALTYIAIGDKTNPYINKIINNSIGEQGIMSLVFGLHLLNNGCKCNAYSVNELVDELLSLQLEDGGFSLVGENGDVDVTAMTVQALSFHYNDNLTVKSAIDDAVDFLSDRQLKNGRYSSYGVENPESAAQVIIALSSLGIDVCNDDRFIKNGNTVFDGISGFLLADGSFCHKEGGTSNSTATAQVMCASIAYENMKNDKQLFYIFDENKITSEENVTEAITAEITLTEPTSVTATTGLVENTLEISDAITSEPDMHKSEQTEKVEEKNDSFRIIIIFVCVVSALVCVMFFVRKKHKIAIIVAVVTFALFSLFIGTSAKDKTDVIGSVTISINCDTVKDKGKSHIPKNGIILEETEIEIQNGDTVYDVFAGVCKENGILFSANMGYIEGINNLFEMDFGKSSGWIYFVNGETPSVGCQSYGLIDGDRIEWHYTCDLGKDLDNNLK
ncbi:MAG: DUF4430 domain-containing protein [Clostridia bacterium]|nr:DUF4430 domain-containing protein [Clostridia bacterium]